MPQTWPYQRLGFECRRVEPISAVIRVTSRNVRYQPLVSAGIIVAAQHLADAPRRNPSPFSAALAGRERPIRNLRVCATQTQRRHSLDDHFGALGIIAL